MNARRKYQYTQYSLNISVFNYGNLNLITDILSNTFQYIICVVTISVYSYYTTVYTNYQEIFSI